MSNEVERHYAHVATEVLDSLDEDAICGRDSCCDSVLNAGEVSLYAQEIIDSLPEGAKAASRGCGDPVSKADLTEGETVCDLGSGGGIDALIAARIVGSAGHVYGVDMTDEMIELARRNAHDAGSSNVEFLRGRIEDIPLPDASVDAVISNCVINLSSDKPAVLREACRILRLGGRLVVSDIVNFDTSGAFRALPDEAKEALCCITGCINGITDAAVYEDMLRTAGFDRVEIEPKTIYTMDVLEEKAQRKDRLSSFEIIADHPEIDGVCGSAIITAAKNGACDTEGGISA